MTLGAGEKVYLIGGILPVNIAIAVNNNGAGVTVNMSIVNEYGARGTPISIPPYTSQFIGGETSQQIVLTGNGANISILVTTEDEEVRIDPITLKQTVSPSTSDPRYLAIYENRYFAAVAFGIIPSAATNRVGVRLRNPPNSGVNIVITYIKVLCNAARVFWLSTNNPTANRSAILNRVNKAAAPSGLSASKAIPSQDTNITVDPIGTVTVHRETLQANVPVEYREPLLIRPGTGTDPVAMGAYEIQIGDASDAVTDLMTIELEWYEEAAIA